MPILRRPSVAICTASIQSVQPFGTMIAKAIGWPVGVVRKPSPPFL